MDSVADLQLALRARLQPVNGVMYLPAHVFYRLRRALIDLYGRERADIRIDDPLDSYFPLIGRKASWKTFAATLDLTLPGLERPSWMTLVIKVLGVLLGIILVCWALSAVDVLPVWQQPFLRLLKTLLRGFFEDHHTVLFLIVLCTVAFERLTVPCAVLIPSRCRTLRLLADTLVSKHDTRLREEIGAWDEARIGRALAEVIGKECGRAPGEVTPEMLLRELCGG